MRQSNQIDLRSAGGNKALTVTPGNSAVYQFNAQQSRIGASGGGRGLYNCVRGISLSCLATIVRSSGGTTVVYPDQFPRVIKSINWNTPMFGTLIDPNVVNGMVAKHISEYFDGYRRWGIDRQPIPGSDATYTRNFELYLPLRQRWNANPDHFAKWLGWLDESTLELFVEDTAQPFGLSGVTITSVVFQAKLDMVPWPELIIPPVAVVRKYEQAAAAGTNGPQLVGVGGSGTLQGADDTARLVAMLYSHQAGGFTGSGTADQISSVTLGWRDQIQSTLPEGFFERFLASGYNQRQAIQTGIDIFDMSAPYTMPNTPATGSRLNDAGARYTPFVWPELGCQISYLQKVKGNYPLDLVFSATQSGQMKAYTIELKQYSLQKCSEMIAAAGIDPESVELVAKMAKKNVKPVPESKKFCFPRGIQRKTKKAA